MGNNEKIVEGLTKYYHGKLLQYGATPQGVGWKDDSAQQIRFEQLLKVLRTDSGFVINDLGCGYGMLFGYMLRKPYHNFKYIGYDLSYKMIRKAKSIYKNENCEYYRIKDATELKQADYTIASGIFNLKMGHTNREWYDYLTFTLDIMNSVSRKGFSFNCLTKYSDKHLMKNELYYADPCRLFGHCKKYYSRNVALLHDYEIYDFTIIVRKD
jgi:SAM-dependent methyltransferase